MRISILGIRGQHRRQSCHSRESGNLDAWYMDSRLRGNDIVWVLKIFRMSLFDQDVGKTRLFCITLRKHLVRYVQSRAWDLNTVATGKLRWKSGNKTNWFKMECIQSLPDVMMMHGNSAGCLPYHLRYTQQG
jgi:hypothetical protein